MELKPNSSQIRKRSRHRLIVPDGIETVLLAHPASAGHGSLIVPDGIETTCLELQAI